MSLFSSLQNSTNALQVLGRQFNTIQNNITNANTPGYVRQDQVVVSQPFNLDQGITGGILAGPTVSARSTYLEQSVRQQNQLLGDAQQRATDLGTIESQFDLTSQFGVSNALNGFFNSFSQLAVNPNDSVARQAVLDQAQQIATAFNQASTSLQQVGVNASQQTQDTVNSINGLAQQIAGINKLYRASAGMSQDAGLDAQLNSALEELSGLTNYTLVRTSDGAANVYIGGQTILVMGDKARPVSADFSTPQALIRDQAGNDITSQIDSGRLGALIREKNTLIPGYTSQLDALAASFADNVNATLAGGVGRDGLPPPVPMFAYSATGSVAASLSVNSLTPDQVAAATAAAPSGNGNAIAVSQLATQRLAGGFTFTQAFGNIGAQVGRDVSVAKNEQSQYTDTLAQARQFRQQQSGVSLDSEAAKLLQFQQAYSAMGKLIGVLSDLTDTVMNIIH